jgi:hypothetical protein
VNRVMIPLLTTSMMTPSERAAGRFMRAPDHPAGGDTPPAGGGDSPPPQNNPQGNPGESATGGEGGDNDGQSLDLTGFWGNQDEPAAVDDSTESAAASTALGQELKTESTGSTRRQSLRKRLVNRLQRATSTESTRLLLTRIKRRCNSPCC